MMNRKQYLKRRLDDPTLIITDQELKILMKDLSNLKPLRNSKINFYGKRPVDKFDSKGESDAVAMSFWNELFPSEFHVRSVKDFKIKAKLYIDRIDRLDPTGLSIPIEDLIRYVTAQSASSFLGIQNPTKSNFSFDSMVKTLKSHNEAKITVKPWLLNRLSFLENHLHKNHHIMDKDYGNICMNAKVSSSSTGTKINYRDYVMQHSLDDIIRILRTEVTYLIYAGIRMDRRAKYRLICSFHAALRIIDYLLVNGSYDICSHGGILSDFTTEGFNNKKMWPSLARMSNRNGVSMACLDFEGYDTQLSQLEYAQITWLLNKHRCNSDWILDRSLMWFLQWLLQPKPLVVRDGASIEVVIEHFHTFASGLHGTHSFENLVGVATNFEARKRGIDVEHFWVNGDDQNALVKSDHMEDYMNFIDKYFRVSWDKSLINHELSVWGKLWFSKRLHPMWEIGTLRSIWEREGGETNMVEPSKFESNYCKILQMLITLIRLGKSDPVVWYWAEKMCSLNNPSIDPVRIPLRLRELSNLPVSKVVRRDIPKGLRDSKEFLFKTDTSMFMFDESNMYDLLLGMYQSQSKFSLDIGKIKYLPSNTKITILSGFDYSHKVDRDVPFMFRDLFDAHRLNPEQSLVQSVLQSTKSYDGPVNKEFTFSNMVELAHAINDRNKAIWEILN